MITEATGPQPTLAGAVAALLPTLNGRPREDPPSSGWPPKSYWWRPASFRTSQ